MRGDVKGRVETSLGNNVNHRTKLCVKGEGCKATGMRTRYKSGSRNRKTES